MGIASPDQVCSDCGNATIGCQFEETSDNTHCVAAAVPSLSQVYLFNVERLNDDS